MCLVLHSFILAVKVLPVYEQNTGKVVTYTLPPGLSSWGIGSFTLVNVLRKVSYHPRHCSDVYPLGILLYNLLTQSFDVNSDTLTSIQEVYAYLHTNVGRALIILEL